MLAAICSLQLKFYSDIVCPVTSDSNIFGPPLLSIFRSLILCVGQTDILGLGPILPQLAGHKHPEIHTS